MNNAEFFQDWKPFVDKQPVRLRVEHNGIEAGLTGKVDLRNTNFFWVLWDDGKRYSSFNRYQLNKLEII